jgi:hypothetical protein
MLDDKSLLDLCLSITGIFENGTPSYSALTGNFDGMGLSAGILQWNAGQGSLQTLLLNIGERMGWDKAQSFFKSDIHHLALLPPADAVAFCLDHYVMTGGTKLDPGAEARWREFLGQPESIDAQTEMAINSVLLRAKALVGKFCPGYTERTRAVAFFFDLVTQSGGMQNARGHVDPLPPGINPNYQPAIDLAVAHNMKCAGIWEVAVAGDDLAQLLLHYTFLRSSLSKPEYVWDALSRRGSIACRGGVVHGVTLNFTSKLD